MNKFKNNFLSSVWTLINIQNKLNKSIVLKKLWLSSRSSISSSNSEGDESTRLSCVSPKFCRTQGKIIFYFIVFFLIFPSIDNLKIDAEKSDKKMSSTYVIQNQLCTGPLVYREYPTVFVYIQLPSSSISVS